MSKEQYSENKQSSNNFSSDKSSNMEKFTPEELEEMKYYFNEISPLKLGGKIINFDEETLN